MPEQTLTIYLENGSRFRFERVTNFVRHEDSRMEFDYVLQSRGVVAHANIFGYKLAGWSIGE
jgi:hypothetical protein